MGGCRAGPGPGWQFSAPGFASTSTATLNVRGTGLFKRANEKLTCACRDSDTHRQAHTHLCECTPHQTCPHTEPCVCAHMHMHTPTPAYIHILRRHMYTPSAHAHTHKCNVGSCTHTRKCTHAHTFLRTCTCPGWQAGPWTEISLGRASMLAPRWRGWASSAPSRPVFPLCCLRKRSSWFSPVHSVCSLEGRAAAA